MPLRPDEWKNLFELRDDLDGEDRALLRRAIKYLEKLEQKVRALNQQLRKQEEENGL